MQGGYYSNYLACANSFWISREVKGGAVITSMMPCSTHTNSSPPIIKDWFLPNLQQLIGSYQTYHHS